MNAARITIAAAYNPEIEIPALDAESVRDRQPTGRHASRLWISRLQRAIKVVV